MNRMHASPAVISLFLALAPSTLASNTLYVDGVNGNDSNNCTSAQTACKTIGHAISLTSSGDSIMVAPATYTENLTINFSLNLIGSGANTTIIDGGGNSTVVTISSTSGLVTLSRFTIRNGSANTGGGIYNSGTLTINQSIVSANRARILTNGSTLGGGIYNTAVLILNNSTVTGNTAVATARFEYAYGGGIANNHGTLAISNSTISGNSALLGIVNGSGRAYGGGIANLLGTLVINNSTISGNSARATLFTTSYGGAISSGSTATISNTTMSSNSAHYGGGISGSATLQNTIVANSSGGNCDAGATITSHGYNLSSDGTCNFNSRGDLNNHDPLLGPLQNNGGPTQTMALLPGSPAIDGGNPSGCTDNQGHLLTTDQRGMARPDPEDIVGCDIGAYESQSDQL